MAFDQRTAPRTSDQSLASSGQVARRRRRRVGRVRWYSYVLLVLGVVACVFPIYWMFVVMTNAPGAAARMPPALVPGTHFVEVSKLVLVTVPFLRSMANSVIVASVVAFGQAFLCALAGFAFARMSFRGRNVLFLLVVFTMTVPAQLSIVPQYMIMSQFHWVDTLQALIVPGMVSAFGIFWMRQHITSTISDELLHAARIDGANSWQIFWRIVLPIVRPAAFVLGLLGFIAAWNDFLWPFIILKSPEMFTVQLAIKALQGNYYVDLRLAMAGAFLATVPLLFVFVFVGRKMVAGIMEGAFKG